MDVVTEDLRTLIVRQVDDKGPVVWYDPQQAYCSAAAELTLPNTLAHCDDRFFKLRKDIDHLMGNRRSTYSSRGKKTGYDRKNWSKANTNVPPSASNFARSGW